MATPKKPTKKAPEKSSDEQRLDAAVPGWADMTLLEVRQAIGRCPHTARSALRKTYNRLIKG